MNKNFAKVPSIVHVTTYAIQANKTENIADFHKQHFNDFVDDSVDWLQGNP